MTSTGTKKIGTECICCLYILLFVYAATNKLIDFENFQVQLAQSPLLSSFAGWVSLMVPILELIIAGLLCFQKTRLLALYAAFSLMAMFSIYIIIILNFSPFVPCSCGGILEKLLWPQHLFFNLIFCLIAIAGIAFENQINNSPLQLGRPIIAIPALTILSAGIMTFLFVVSEDMFHHRNNFTRRFPPHPAEFLHDVQLASASCYFAGAGNGKIYLGDVYNPLTIMEIDANSKKTVTHTIHTNEPDRLCRKLRVAVKPPYFYLSDGIEAFAFRGTISDWKATIWLDRIAYYNAFVPIDSIRVGIRSLSGDHNENMIGVMQRGQPSNAIFNAKLLDKQIDGVFDTDGKLLFNDKHKKLLYVYAYRNEYLVTDPALQLKITGRTIDTTSRAKIKVAYVHKLKASKLASPARIVNKTAATDGDFLFVNSKQIGQFEPESTWDEASIIDVYNFLTKAYLFSFHLYDKEQNKISEFIVDSGKAYTLAGRTLTVYHLDPIPFVKNN